MRNNTIIYQDLLEGLSLEVTTECNLSCTNCFALAGINKKIDLDFDKAFNIVKEGYDLGFRSLHLTGGETFLWQHIFHLLDFAFELGYTQIVINTNAILLTDKVCKKLFPYGKKLKLTCSINGDKSAHEYFRGQGTYIKSCAGIKKALEHEISVDIFTTAGKTLLPKLPLFVDNLFARFSGINSLFLIQLRNTQSETGQTRLQMLSPDEFINLVQVAGLLTLKGYPISFLENPLTNVVAGTLNINWMPKSPMITRYGKITLLSNGDITANHSSRDSYGSYSPGRLEEVLSSAGYVDDTGANKDICPVCQFSTLCRSQGMLHPSSVDHNDNGTRDSGAESLFCKKVLQRCVEGSKTINHAELTE